MMDDKDDMIRDRAYAIWQEEGRPEGRDADHWHRAEAEQAAGPVDTDDDPTAAVDASGLPGADPSAAAPAWEEPAAPNTTTDAPAAASPLAKLKKKTAKIAKSL